VGVRPEVQRLLDLGPMPDEREDVPLARVEAYHEALDSLQPLVLTDEEAAALLDVFPVAEYGSLFELEWSLVHAVETAPYGRDLLAQLDNRSWWVAQLRGRAERGGLL
jgi:hypothetical protein